MFIRSDRYGYIGTGQYASGLFLAVFCNANAPKLPNGYKPLRAIVRKVALHQLGHFMMGRLTLMGHPFSLSGTYGSDGLPIEITTYGRRNVPPKPEEFSSLEEHQAYYDNLATIPYETYEMVPGLWERLHPLPDDLVAEFWNGGGHNSAGAEGLSMHEWASTNLETLRHLLPKKGR